MRDFGTIARSLVDTFALAGVKFPDAAREEGAWRSIAVHLEAAEAAGFERGRDAAAEKAGMLVCRLNDLPCDGRARVGDQCGCVTANIIAARIRALRPGEGTR